jgi:hypothetical protein
MNPPFVVSEFEVVARRVNRSWTRVERLLRDSTLFVAGTRVQLTSGAVLRLDASFAPARWALVSTWQASGRLYGRGRRRSVFTRVKLDVTAWSDDASELRLRPVTRHFGSWGARRQRRYFAIAHECADHMLGDLRFRSMAARSRSARCQTATREDRGTWLREPRTS